MKTKINKRIFKGKKYTLVGQQGSVIYPRGWWLENNSTGDTTFLDTNMDWFFLFRWLYYRSRKLFNGALEKEYNRSAEHNAIKTIDK